MVLQSTEKWADITSEEPGKVCVVDSGYYYDHPDLLKEPNVNGTDSDEAGHWYQDGHGHGTHVAGTVAAVDGNGIGVRGVISKENYKQFQLLIGRGLDDNNEGSTSNILLAVEGCVKQGANVVNLSLGGVRTWAEEFFYEKLYNDYDVLIISTAGNDGYKCVGNGDNCKEYPSSYPTVMSVAAIDENENWANYSELVVSHFNDQVEIAAPGVGICSTVPPSKGLYASWYGTSMAAPHVAGVAGILRMHFPWCRNYQIRNALLKSAKDISNPGCDMYVGYGLVQALDAYNLLLNDCGGDIGHSTPKGGCDQLYSSKKKKKNKKKKKKKNRKSNKLD